MAKYRVYLKAGVCDAGTPSQLLVEAEDVNLDSAGEGETIGMFWNFLGNRDKNGDAVTVAGFPFELVAFFVTSA